MPCNCQSYECLEANFNPCSEGVPLNITSAETGTWTGSIEFNGLWTDFAFGVEAGERIVIPISLLNEFYTHKAKFYNTDGDLINDTCYNILARATLSAGTFDPIPPDTLQQILEDISILQSDVLGLQQEIDDLQQQIDTADGSIVLQGNGTDTVGDHFLTGKTIVAISSNGVVIGPSGFDHNSSEITLKDGSGMSGDVIIWYNLPST